MMDDEATPAPGGWPAGITAEGRNFAVDAALVAPALGLEPAQFMDELQRGFVSSVVERGMGEDAGRTRLTLLYQKRSWSVVLEGNAP